MSTKKITTTKQAGSQKVAFDPASMKAFQGLQPAFANLLLQYLNEPARKTQEQLRIGQGEYAIGQAFGRQQENLVQNALALGMPSAVAPGYFQSQLARSGRARAGASAQNVIQNKFFTDRSAQALLPLAAAYRPLQTGGSFQSQGTTTAKTSGLGTWLPQVASAAIGAAAGAATGGAAGGGGFTGTGQMTANPASWPGGLFGQPAPPYPGFNPLGP